MALDADTTACWAQASAGSWKGFCQIAAVIAQQAPATGERRHWNVCRVKGQRFIGVMETSDQIKANSGFVALATANGTLVRSVITGVVVGTVLTAINQGDVIMAGESPSLIKIGLNYLVPYCVATYSAVMAKQYALRDPGD